MFLPALKRLFLVLFPVLLFVTALYLSHTRRPKQALTFQKQAEKPCPFYLGVSFFSQKENFQPYQLTTYILSENNFTKKIQDLRLYFEKKNISLKQVFFALPLTLTKEEDWIVSQKTFFILPTGERKHISHLTYSEINHFHKSLWNAPLWLRETRRRGTGKEDKNSSKQEGSSNKQTENSNKQERNSNKQPEKPNKQKGSSNKQPEKPNKQRKNPSKQTENSNKPKGYLNKQTEKPSYQALKLDQILSSLPKKSNFLFYLLGSNRKKIIKNLNKIQDKVQGRLYLSSSNEKMLKDLLLYQSCSNFKDLSTNSQQNKKDECLAEASNRIGLPADSLKQPLKNNIKILHSFKTLIRLEILSLFPRLFKPIQGAGLIAPNSLPLNQKSLRLLKQENKLLFFQKDPPYSLEDKKRIQNSQALISSQIKLAISSIKDKKTCLLKN